MLRLRGVGKVYDAWASTHAAEVLVRFEERKTSRSSRNRHFGAKERWVNRSACRCSLQGSYVTRFGRRARRHLR